jgi:hypothetical protein
MFFRVQFDFMTVYYSTKSREKKFFTQIYLVVVLLKQLAVQAAAVLRPRLDLALARL